ncbi:MAG: dienelactone hydrolase family protein [Chitinophagaceae bacterium]
MLRSLTLVTLLFLTKMAVGQDNNSLYEKHVFVSGTDTLPYRLLLPAHYDASKKYPLILLLHGAGERGKNNTTQLRHGSKLYADSLTREKFPAFVVLPQCSGVDFWARIGFTNDPKDSLKPLTFPSEQPIGKSLGMVNQLLDSLAASGKVDIKRIYVGGLSMGGMGTFELLWRKPNFFAAAFPVCGGGDPGKVSLYAKDFPVWVFHGDNDKTVMPGYSRQMVNALKAAGAKVKYTEYPGVAHNSWDKAFVEPELLPWLFKQSRR